MNTSLSLPRLHGAVPARLLPVAGRAERCAIAAFLAKAGMIDAYSVPPDWIAGNDDEIDIALQALENWFRREAPHLGCLDPNFIVESMYEIDPEATPSNKIEAPVIGLKIKWGERNVSRWTVGAGFEALEQAVPRLGATVLDVIDKQGGLVYPLFTPAVALEQASLLFWYGEEDESLLLEDLAGQCSESEIEAMRDDIVTKEDIDAAFPAWATNLTRARLSERALSTVATRHTDRFVRTAASLALRLLRLRPVSNFMPKCEGEGVYIGFGAVLCWRDNDIAMRLSDAMAQRAWEGDEETYDHIGEIELHIGDIKGMRDWMRAMRRQLRMIALLDALIEHLAAR